MGAIAILYAGIRDTHLAFSFPYKQAPNKQVLYSQTLTGKEWQTLKAAVLWTIGTERV